MKYISSKGCLSFSMIGDCLSLLQLPHQRTEAAFWPCPLVQWSQLPKALEGEVGGKGGVSSLEGVGKGVVVT